MITNLQPHEVFVFGSNLAGHHAGGAAHQAHTDFGAVWGIGEGLTGQCYAFPTLGVNMEQLDHETMQSVRDAFYRCCNAHPGKVFLLTPVGTGIAGYDPTYIEELFNDLPTNVVKVGWEK